MPSSLTWLDHDQSARERSLGLLALFNEKESRDELGIGAIRDSLADQLFPGTSTIQTRLRYMLLVPWIYQKLEEAQVPAHEFAALARRRETELIGPLLESQDERGAELYGVIGRLARGGLKRLPSSIYWAGLGTWRIRRYGGTQSQYHQAVDDLYVRRAQRRKTDSDEWVSENQFDTWHPKLPKPPASFPAKIGFALRKEDATFLRDCVLTACDGSYLAWLVSQDAEPDSDYPWDYPNAADVTPDIKRLLKHARLFSALLHGASLLYNLLLSEQREQKEWVKHYRDELADYAKAPWSQLGQWDLADFWSTARASTHTVRPSAVDFVTKWLGLAKAHSGAVADVIEARELVQSREMDLKRSQSRFLNRAALNQWGGASGTSRLDFRWPIVKTFLADLSLTEKA